MTYGFAPAATFGALLGTAGLVNMFWGSGSSSPAPAAGAPPPTAPGSPGFPGGVIFPGGGTGAGSDKDQNGGSGGVPYFPPPIDFTKPITPSSGEGVPGSGVVDINAAEFFLRYGHPGPVSDQAIRDEFVSFFDRRTRNPHYVIEHITAQSLGYTANPPVDRKSSVFREDPSIPQMFKARLTDYFRSGFDRGHMAPAADAKFSQNAMDQTFYLTNMSPQVGDGFNRDYWAHFEDFCRRLTHKYKSVRIVTGPLYLPQRGPDGRFRVTYEVIGDPPGVAVPTHFYKIIVGEEPTNGTKGPSTEVAIGAFVLPNAPIDNKTPLKSFLVPVSAIERATGLEFFTKLQDRNKKDLCQRVDCQIIVRDFSNSVKALPAPRK